MDVVHTGSRSHRLTRCLPSATLVTVAHAVFHYILNRKSQLLLYYLLIIISVYLFARLLVDLLHRWGAFRALFGLFWFGVACGVRMLDVGAHLNNLHWKTQIGTLHDHYLFKLHCDEPMISSCHRRERRDTHTAYLSDHADVHWVQQQVGRSRARRRTIPPHLWGPGSVQRRGRNAVAAQTFTDPHFKKQWHLQNQVLLHHDINVVAAWEAGYTGKGVVLTIVDDGLEHDHPDLIANYDPAASKDLNDGDDDPYPDVTQEINRHGTRCAGEIGATANNGVCGVGVAYNSNIGGVRMLDGDVTDAVEAASLSLNPQHIDIYTNSWGPNDDGRVMEGPSPLALKAFKAGIQYGRNGKGSLFLFASGNGGPTDNCNADGYANAPFTIAISAVDYNGEQPFYVEPCAAALASTYSSGAGHAITTTDLHHKCTDGHSGTSAAAPLAAGILALVLEARPELTWRDVQHLMVHTASQNSPLDASWFTNTAGLHHSHLFGFGLMDAKKMVDTAKTWELVKPKKVFRTFRINHESPFNATLTSNTFLNLTEARGIDKLEYVQVHAYINSQSRGKVNIELICPSGTPSTLLTSRPDRSTSPIDFSFSTVRCWGEPSLGVYRLLVNFDSMADVPEEENGNMVVAWGLSVHGTTPDDYVDLDAVHPPQRSAPIGWNSSGTPSSTRVWCLNPMYTLERSPPESPHGDVCRDTKSNEFECPLACHKSQHATRPFCSQDDGVTGNDKVSPCRVPAEKGGCKCSLKPGAPLHYKTFCNIAEADECTSGTASTLCECEPTARATFSTKRQLHETFEAKKQTSMAKHKLQARFGNLSTAH